MDVQVTEQDLLAASGGCIQCFQQIGRAGSGSDRAGRIDGGILVLRALVCERTC